jgi:hypothetical protein
MGLTLAGLAIWRDADQINSRAEALRSEVGDQRSEGVHEDRWKMKDLFGLRSLGFAFSYDQQVELRPDKSLGRGKMDEERL